MVALVAVDLLRQGKFAQQLGIYNTNYEALVASPNANAEMRKREQMKTHPSRSFQL